MTKIVGIRFRTAGKIYYFDPADFDLDMAMHVIVETARGIEMGTVLIPPKEVDDDQVVSPLKPVIRVATDEDEKTVERNKEKEKEAFAICKEKIIKYGLEMKLVDAEYTFDGNKLLFYFTADGRIDFRELVKDLAAVFRTRIELRQIGVRDETKMMGGIGICGRPLCCHSYMADFVPVSIKMAKEQNLSLNPTKISGVCGRLMCCLKYEQGGKNLSGGQKQRLTIARAVVKDPDILILDDSASALDFATDASLRAALKGMHGDKTIFIVSQRTSSIQFADNIIVLDDGQMVGFGPHEKLLETCETYKEIYDSQFKKESDMTRQKEV